MEAGREEDVGLQQEGTHRGLVCDTCGADHEEGYLHPRCHPDAPVCLKLTPEGATVECAECEDVLFKLNIVGTHRGGLNVEFANLEKEFRPTLAEIGVIACDHLDHVRCTEFEWDVAGESSICVHCYGECRRRLDDIKRLMGDQEFSAATREVEERWSKRIADKRYFRRCEACGSCAIDTRLGEACAACGDGANAKQAA